MINYCALFLSFNQKINDVYDKMKNGIYLLND